MPEISTPIAGDKGRIVSDDERTSSIENLPDMKALTEDRPETSLGRKS